VGDSSGCAPRQRLRAGQKANDDSTMKPDWQLLSYLFNAGRDEAGKWLSRHRASIGRRSTVDLKERFLTVERACDPGADADSERASVKAKAAAGSDIAD